MTDSIFASFRLKAGESPETHPKGLSVATWLQEELEHCGLQCTLENWRDSGYSLDCKVAGTPVYVVISSAPQHDDCWLAMCSSDRGLIGRLVRGSDAKERRDLASLVHAALSNDGRVSGVRWYLPKWDGDLDASWAPQP
jgi:hypothetical protein